VVYAVISDIHANSEALRAVLAEIDRRSVDAVLCAGDLVGYNADPDACVEDVLSRAAATVRGNHDRAVAGLMDLDWFNTAAREAALWARGAVTPRTLERLSRLPRGPVSVGKDVILCHGSPSDEDEYLLPGTALGDAFRYLEDHAPAARLCFHGHTHLPLAVCRSRRDRSSRMLGLGQPIEIEPETLYLLNPGSVGQPRDGNTRASFGILDTGRGTFTIIRVAYAFRETQRKILEAGLPSSLARRLGEGR